MILPPHPSIFLSPGIADVLRAKSAEAEVMRDLHPDQLDLIYRQQWFRMLLPENPLPLPELVRLEEGISWADGPVGWTVTLCSGAGWFAGFFPPGVVPDIFSDKQMCLAGSGAPSGEAHVVPGGYRINGRWDYASGALHATAFTANCHILENGQKVLTDDRSPVVRAFLFRKEEVSVDRNWNTIGLIATGSHAFEVKNAEIPADRCCDIASSQAKAGHPIYRYPFLQLAEATLAANLSGMGMHFLDCARSFFHQRSRSGRVPAGAAQEMNAALEEAQETIGAKRTEFYKTLDRSWENQANFDAVSQCSRGLVTEVRRMVDQLYPYGGLGAARPDTEINRVWRDLHTASQHNLLVFGR
jgi:alkylation response protein AidB-like acyl-CoA dehydrogenase